MDPSNTRNQVNVVKKQNRLDLATEAAPKGNRLDANNALANQMNGSSGSVTEQEASTMRRALNHLAR